MSLLISIAGSVIGTLIVGPIKWLGTKIRGRPTTEARDRSVAAGRDVSGQVATGDQPTVAGQAGVQMGPGSVVHIHQEGLDMEGRERLVRMESLLNEINDRMASPQTAEADTELLARLATERTEQLLAEAVELQRQHKEREAIERLLTAYEMDMPTEAKAELHLLAGNGFARLSEFEEAEGHYRQALAAAKEAGDRLGQTNALTALAAVYVSRGDLAKAEDHLDEADRLLDDVGDKLGQLQILIELGMAVAKGADGTKAHDLLSKAVAILQDAGVGGEWPRKAKEALAQLEADSKID